ncbi:hypothetical protein [Streptomyces noursei]|uniref:hypothetical protein n=1 Tax=Streptomyces noursei TaxID=1971 RepID=UPI0011AF2371
MGARTGEQGDQASTARSGTRAALQEPGNGTAGDLYGYLLAHYALSDLRCRAATEAGIDPDRIKFTRTVRIVRRSVTDAAAFSP